MQRTINVFEDSSVALKVRNRYLNVAWNFVFVTTYSHANHVHDII